MELILSIRLQGYQSLRGVYKEVPARELEREIERSERGPQTVELQPKWRDLTLKLNAVKPATKASKFTWENIQGRKGSREKHRHNCSLVYGGAQTGLLTNWNQSLLYLEGTSGRASCPQFKETLATFFLSATPANLQKLRGAREESSKWPPTAALAQIQKHSSIQNPFRG